MNPVWQPARRDAHTAGDTGAGQPVSPARPPLVESAELFQGHRAVEIHHNGELYRLQATRTGKLILTK